MTPAEQRLIDVALLMAQELQECVNDAIEASGDMDSLPTVQALLLDWEEAHLVWWSFSAEPEQSEKLHADGIVRVFKRMWIEYQDHWKDGMKEHIKRAIRRPIPLGHEYWNLFTEACRIREAAYLNGHLVGFLFATQVVAGILLYWKW